MLQFDLNEAHALLQGDSRCASRLATALIVPRSDNFVERPWGGARMHEYKGVARPARGAPLGEAFELAAFDADAEARAYPSVVPLADGVAIPLPRLLEQHGDALLGEAFVARYGRRWPLLPKTLDVGELLSVQAHPEGNTEAYLIIAADAGATIRLGFNSDVDADALGARLEAGRRNQEALLAALTLEPAALQRLLRPWLAQRNADAAALEAALRPALREQGDWPHVATLLRALHELYWHVLELMNAVPVEAGQVIYNANPPRITAATGRQPSAEVHALGNPEGRAILALEIRRPGPTFRAWDNVRFPVREVDTKAALAALSLRATAPEEFIVRPRPVRPGVLVSVDGPQFRIEHLRPTSAQSIDVPASAPHSLHVLQGEARIYGGGGALVGKLTRGQSALVPVGVGAYRVASDAPQTEIVRVSLPE